MADIFETTIICDDCDKKTIKNEIYKEGFRLRLWECPNCGKRWYHPEDKQDYDDFQRIKQKQFQVKLRMVGNSYTISIPREIVDFEEEFNSEFDKLLKLTLEEPGKLSIFFDRRIRKIFNNKEH